MATAIGIKTFFKARNAKREAKFEEDILRHNAEVTRQKGVHEFNRRIQQVQILAGQQNKVRSANIARGAPLFALKENAVNAAINRKQLLDEAITSRTAAETQASVFDFKADVAKEAGKQRRNAAVLEGVTEAASQATKLFTFGLGL